MTALRLAALFLALSALAHLAAALHTHFAGETRPLLGFGIAWLVLALMLWRRGSRLLSWVVFFAMLVFGIAALAQTGGDGAVPDWMMYIIAALDFLCAACLWVVLWRKPLRLHPT